MTRLMGEQIGQDTGIRVEVSDMEITREGKSYTADTLRALRAQYPDDELWLLMGTDMFLTFQYWYRPEEILRYAGICAFGRTETDGEELFAPQRAFLAGQFPGSRIVTMTLPNLVDVSSTELRTRIPRGKTDGLLAPAVLGYILRKHLYGTNLDLKRLSITELRPIALSYLKAKRIPHVLGTEKTAAALAEKYGADTRKARVAALLHTTGKPGMTLLEKVIYLADFIEPSRDFDGVDALRSVVWEDLDKGLAMGLSMTVEEMTGMGAPIHRNTLEALDDLRGHNHE